MIRKCDCNRVPITKECFDAEQKTGKKFCPKCGAVYKLVEAEIWGIYVRTEEAGHNPFTGAGQTISLAKLKELLEESGDGR